MKPILIAAGHGTRPDGSYDPGALSRDNKLREHDLNVKVCLQVSNYMQSMYPDIPIQLEIGLTSNKPHDANWIGTVNMLKTNKYSFGIEIHHDTYLAPNRGFGILPRALKQNNLAKLVATQIALNYSLQGQLIKDSYPDVRGLGFLKRPTVPTLIWECGSMVSNSADLITLSARSRAIAIGLSHVKSA